MIFTKGDITVDVLTKVTDTSFSHEFGTELGQDVEFELEDWEGCTKGEAEKFIEDNEITMKQYFFERFSDHNE